MGKGVKFAILFVIVFASFFVSAVTTDETNLSVYVNNETYVPPPNITDDGGSLGGGGGGGSDDGGTVNVTEVNETLESYKEEEKEVVPTQFEYEYSLNPGKIEYGSILLINAGPDDINYTVVQEGLEGKLFLDNKSIDVPAGGSERLNFKLVAGDIVGNYRGDVYLNYFDSDLLPNQKIITFTLKVSEPILENDYVRIVLILILVFLLVVLVLMIYFAMRIFFKSRKILSRYTPEEAIEEFDELEDEMNYVAGPLERFVNTISMDLIRMLYSP